MDSILHEGMRDDYQPVNLNHDVSLIVQKKMWVNNMKPDRSAAAVIALVLNLTVTKENNMLFIVSEVLFVCWVNNNDVR